MITVRVIKSKWCRGKAKGSLLLTSGGKMCCIGFLARKLGARPKDIRGITTLSDTSHTKCLDFDSSTRLSSLNNAYETNDDPAITDKDRIPKLRAIGKEMGARFVFVDK